MNNNINKTISILLLAGMLISAVSCDMLRPPTPETSRFDQSGPSPTDTEAEETEPPVTYKTELIIEDPAPVGIDVLSAQLTENPKLELFNTGTTVLTVDEYISLRTINPETRIISQVNFEDTVLDLSLTEIDISEKQIVDREKFDTLLSYLPAGIKLVMCDCGYTNEEMGSLREKHPHLKFAWRLYLGRYWKLRTDDEAFSVMIFHYDFVRMTSEDIEVLKYCTNMKALDLGHQAITDISVIGQMRELRVLILADNKITDVSPLANLTKLQYLELFVNRITDMSPLAQCTELVDLNIGWNRGLNDISCLYSLDKIERLWLPTTGVPYAVRDEISENFPEAQIVFVDKDSISSGWRTHRRYFIMRGMFNENKYNPDFVT